MTETLRERLEQAQADLRYDVEQALLLNAWDNGDLVPRDEHESALSAAREEAARAERERDDYEVWASVERRITEEARRLCSLSCDASCRGCRAELERDWRRDAINSLRAADLAAENAALREALEQVLAFEAERTSSDCGCIFRSKKMEQAYETGQCPHQAARAALLDATRRKLAVNKTREWVVTPGDAPNEHVRRTSDPAD